jgi:hypothetical protein
MPKRKSPPDTDPKKVSHVLLRDASLAFFLLDRSILLLDLFKLLRSQITLGHNGRIGTGTANKKTRQA